MVISNGIKLLVLSVIVTFSVCLLVWWGINTQNDEFEGRWRIVTTHPGMNTRLEKRELVLKRRINITKDGLLIAGRRGLDGVVSQSFFTGTQYLIENGTNDIWYMRRTGKDGRYISLISEKFGETIVAIKDRDKPTRTKHD